MSQQSPSQQEGALGTEQQHGATGADQPYAGHLRPTHAVVQPGPTHAVGEPCPAHAVQPYLRPPYYSCEHPPPRIYQTNVVLTQKSRFVAAVLAFLFGSFGVHNFYLGYNGAGFIQIAMTLLGWMTAWLLIGFFLLVPAVIWAFVEMIVLLVAKTGRYAHSANGVPLS